MTDPIELVEVWRGELMENIHRGHAVICDDTGQIVRAWGDPNAVIYPRSACKMIQALPLIESGAAAAFDLTEQQLALACASHQGAQMHVDAVSTWLTKIGRGDEDFRCGPQEPRDIPTRDTLIRAGQSPCQIHNNCSGKHTGFLTLTRHLNAEADYHLVDHPVQRAGKAALEETTQDESPGYGIDGCSAPNFATTVHGLARAMAFFASASGRTDARAQAAQRLTAAMTAFPEMIAGETGTCTVLMRAMDGKVAIKTGADGVYTAIIPEQKIGVALKIVDGTTRAAECAMAAILVRLGVLAADHPATKAHMVPDILSRRGLHAGFIRPTATLL